MMSAQHAVTVAAEREHLQRERSRSGSSMIGAVWLVFYLSLALWSFIDESRRDETSQAIALSRTATEQ
jgi:hypothetical protein